jgi:hypothetical protein
VTAFYFTSIGLHLKFVKPNPASFLLKQAGRQTCGKVGGVCNPDGTLTHFLRTNLYSAILVGADLRVCPKLAGFPVSVLYTGKNQCPSVLVTVYQFTVCY